MLIRFIKYFGVSEQGTLQNAKILFEITKEIIAILRNYMLRNCLLEQTTILKKIINLNIKCQKNRGLVKTRGKKFRFHVE